MSRLSMVSTCGLKVARLAPEPAGRRVFSWLRIERNIESSFDSLVSLASLPPCRYATERCDKGAESFSGFHAIPVPVPENHAGSGPAPGSWLIPGGRERGRDSLRKDLNAEERDLDPDGMSPV